VPSSVTISSSPGNGGVKVANAVGGAPTLVAGVVSEPPAESDSVLVISVNLSVSGGASEPPAESDSDLVISVNLLAQI